MGMTTSEISKALQRINKREEESRRIMARKKAERARRCFIIGDGLLKSFPGLEEGSDKEALDQLQRILQSIGNCERGSS